MTSGAPPAGDRVSASVFVEAAPALAFEVFVDQIDQWWRHGRKFRQGGRGLSVLHLEHGLGGRLFETIAPSIPGDAPAVGALPHVIQSGTVIDWNPPRTLAFEWRAVNFAPGEKTLVSVAFEPRGEGTVVTIVHSGFAALCADHPVRHGQPVERFIAQMGMWWSDQAGSLRQRVASMIGG